ncbi:MAG: ABC transporter permease [Bauldia sp.]|nr:ABC transporter permease [Bauldia sp.]
MKMLSITAVALKRFIRDRSNLFFVFIMPLGIILLIGAQFGGPQGTRLGVHTPADAGPVAAALLESLDGTGEVTLVAYDDPDAVAGAVALGTVAMGLQIPAGLSARLAAGEDLQLTLIVADGAIAGPMQALLARAIATATVEESAIRFAVAFGADRAEAAAAAAGLVNEVAVVGVAGSEAGESLFEGVASQFEVGATSQLILFMFLTGLTGSAALISARNLGLVRRMLGTPTSPATVVGGEALGRFAVVLVQGLYIVLATMLIFQVDWGNLLGAAAVILVFGASAAAGAMLFGSVFRKEDQAAIVGVVTGLALAALGGCMVPLELFGGTLQTVAHFTPHAWANEAFAELLRRDGTIVDILPQLGVLAGFAVVLLGLAAWRMAATLKTN